MTADRRAALVREMLMTFAGCEGSKKDAMSAALDLALEEAAKVAEDHSWMADIEWWLTATKKEVSAKSAQEIATAIRALKGKP